MSDFKGHFQAGLLVASVLTAMGAVWIMWMGSWLSYQELPVIFVVAILGALWPDTDVGSTSQRYVYLFFIVLDLFLIFGLNLIQEAALFGVFTMLPALSKHRGFTHSFRANVVVGLLWLLLPFVGTGFLVQTAQVHHYRDLIFAGVPCYFAFLAGVLSHLILDRHPYFKRRRSLAKGSKKREKQTAKGGIS